MTRNKTVAMTRYSGAKSSRYAKIDAVTPFKLTVFHKGQIPSKHYFADKQAAIDACNDEEETRILQDFSGKEVKFLKYIYVN